MSALNISTLNRHCAAERVVFGDVTYRPGGVCGPRTQADFQLVLLEQGEASVDIDGASLYVPPQHVALMLPGRREHYRFTRDGITHHSWCAVRPDAVSESLRQRLVAAPRCQALTPRIRNLVEFGLSLPPAGVASADGVIEHIGLAALHEYVFEAETAHHERDQPEALRVACRYIDSHLTEPLALVDIARAAYVTPQYLIKLFRQHLGTTPARYVWQLRVGRGVELLRETGLSIAEIANRTGFKNPFHFSRMVKHQYQLSPRQLRKQAWGDADGDVS
ncbi:MAG: AraC family transcriptional regulator [Chloroflexi bacterium]|nr:AraC family transcriptional regulator [Chloroflexota bacterium]